MATSGALWGATVHPAGASTVMPAAEKLSVRKLPTAAGRLRLGTIVRELPHPATHPAQAIARAAASRRPGASVLPIPVVDRLDPPDQAKAAERDLP